MHSYLLWTVMIKSFKFFCHISQLVKALSFHTRYCWDDKALFLFCLGQTGYWCYYYCLLHFILPISFSLPTFLHCCKKSGITPSLSNLGLLSRKGCSQPVEITDASGLKEDGWETCGTSFWAPNGQWLENHYRPWSEGDNALGSVRLSVCLSMLSRLNRLTCVIRGRIRIIARMRSIGVLILFLFLP